MLLSFPRPGLPLQVPREWSLGDGAKRTESAQPFASCCPFWPVGPSRSPQWNPAFWELRVGPMDGWLSVRMSVTLSP